jgi:hypothetical protein
MMKSWSKSPIWDAGCEIYDVIIERRGARVENRVNKHCHPERIFARACLH